MRKSITSEITDKYKKSYLENSQRINYTQLDDRDGLISVLYDDLPNTSIDGYPVASDLVDENGKVYSSNDFSKLSQEELKNLKLRFHYLNNYHELYVGTTGSGKTTGCVEPQLRAISSQQNKPNLFLTDPKGELFERNARHLKEQGYKIFVMNFKDISRSHRWNPLLDLYYKKQKSLELGKDIVLKEGKIGPDTILGASAEEFCEDYYLEYDGKAFPNGKACDLYISFQKDYLDAEIDSLVNQFVFGMIEIKSMKDPSWEYGAQQLLKGIILCMLEDSINPNSGFTVDMMTICTIQQYYLTLRKDLVSTRASYSLYEHPLLKNKPKRAVAPLAIAFNNAMNTMMSYCGVFDGAIRNWFQGHIFALTTGNTIDLKNLDSPYAVFVITRDYEKSDFTVAGMFIDWVYKQALEEAEHAPRNKNGLPSTRPIHFMLDEFGNIPQIPDFENKIATSRSRNIWFHLVVQSYEQLVFIYGKERATIIIDNCNAQIFLGSQSRATKEQFAKECGKHWVPALISALNPDKTDMTQVEVLPISDLDLIKPGDMFVKRLYKPVIESQYIRSYFCAQLGYFKHFYDTRAIRDFTPININSFYNEKYTYKAVSIYYDNEDDE